MHTSVHALRHAGHPSNQPMHTSVHTLCHAGQYFNPSSRRYAFDMTHVEVFVGGETGEATIGETGRGPFLR